MKKEKEKRTGVSEGEEQCCVIYNITWEEDQSRKLGCKVYDNAVIKRRSQKERTIVL